MPKRRVYKRDSRGRFSGTGKAVHVKGRKGIYPKGKLTGKPIGKGSLPIVERYPGGRANSVALQRKLMAEGHSEDSTVIRSFNTLSGGFTPDRRGLGTYNFVSRHPKTGKVTGTGVAVLSGSVARGYGRSVSVHDVFKAGGRKAPKGAGKHLMSAMAKTAKGADLNKKTYGPTDFQVHGAVSGAKKFYGSVGGNVSKRSSMVDFSITKRNALAGKKVRVRIKRSVR